MDPRREAREESDPRRPVVAEDDPQASTDAPETRAPRPGQDIPHGDRMSDDAEGAGGRGQPEPGAARDTEHQPGGSQPQPHEDRLYPMSRSASGPLGTLAEEEKDREVEG